MTSVGQKKQLTDLSFLKPIGCLQSIEPVIAGSDWTIQQVLEVMKVKHIGGALICATGGQKLLGVFTERDLLHRVAGQGWNYRTYKIKYVMTRDPECLTENDSIGKALNLMLSQGYRHVPILDRSQKPIRLLSIREILDFLKDQLPIGEFSSL